MFVTSGCSDLIEGGLHIAYGVVIILFTILKWGLIIGGVLFIIALIIGLFKR